MIHLNWTTVRKVQISILYSRWELDRAACFFLSSAPAESPVTVVKHCTHGNNNRSNFRTKNMYLRKHTGHEKHLGSFLKCYCTTYLVDYSFAMCKSTVHKEKLTDILTVLYYPGEDDLPTLQPALIYHFSCFCTFSLSGSIEYSNRATQLCLHDNKFIYIPDFFK